MVAVQLEIFRRNEVAETELSLILLPHNSPQTVSTLLRLLQLCLGRPLVKQQVVVVPLALEQLLLWFYERGGI